MTLYDIASEMQALIDEETGEIKDYEAFEALGLEREKKIDNTVLWIKDLEAEAAAIKEEAAKLTARAKVAENKATRLREFLATALAGEKRKTAQYAISYRKSEQVNIEDAAALVEWLENNGHGDAISYKEPTVNKADVKRMIKAGIAVPFAALEDKQNMQIK